MKKLLIVTVIFSITGCAGLNSDFSCNEAATGTCTTVSEANKLGSYSNTKVKLISSNVIAKNNPIANNNDLFEANINTPNRTTEKVYKIWIAPYVDSKDNYHKDQDIYFTAQKTQWKGFQ